MKFYLISVFLLCSVFLYGQDKPKEDTVTISVFNPDDRLNQKSYSFDKLMGFQNYRSFKNALPVARSGNLGLPIHYFDSVSIQSNLEFILGGYMPHVIDKNNIQLYNTNVPFTSLTFVSGAEEEQQFSALHTQNFGKRMNVSFQYDRITSTGFFSRQLTSHTKFNANYRYTSYNNRLESIGYYAVTSLEAMENGGIEVSSEENTDENAILLDINLRNAQNQLRYRTFGFINEYALFGNKDSTSKPNIIAGHELEVIRAARKYADEIAVNGDFYANNFIDTVQTLDSSYGNEFSNSAYIKWSKYNLKAGVKNSRFEYFQNFLINQELNSNFLFIDFQNEFNGFKIQSNLEKGISGFHKKEHELKLGFTYNEGKRISYFAHVISKRKRPNPLMTTSRLNHFFYDQALKDVQQNSIQIGFSDTVSSTALSVSYQQNQDFVYFDKESIIKNYDKDLNILKIRLNKRSQIGKHFNLFNQLVLQAASTDTIIPIPDLVSYTSLYYQSDFFENSLRLQIGADFYYISEFNRLSYNPALAQFHSEQSEVSAGSNLQLDLFLNLRINRSAKVFFKMENLLQPTFSEESYRIQNYAIPGRALKIGIFWRMLN